MCAMILPFYDLFDNIRYKTVLNLLLTLARPFNVICLIIFRLTLEDLPINNLPRESRLVLTLYGRSQRTVDGQHPNESNQQSGQEDEENKDVQYELVELGWAAIQLFDYDGYVVLFLVGLYLEGRICL